MNISRHVAKHFREVHFGGNWTFSNLKDTLSGISVEDATKKVHSLNTIAALTFHINYFVDAVLKVLRGNPLDAHDKFSFTHPEFDSQEEWENFLVKVFSDAEEFAILIEQLPEEKLWEVFSDVKYGIYYRNLHGIIEHTHYHLGQIAVIKKIVIGMKSDNYA